MLFGPLLFPPFFVKTKSSSKSVSPVAYQWVHIAFRESGHFGSFLPDRQHHCVWLWGSIFRLAVWQCGPNKLGRFVVVFVLKLGVKMKWRSPHTRDRECLFNLFSAYQPSRTAGERRGERESIGKAGWMLLQSHDDEVIKVNSSLQTHSINKLMLQKRKDRLSPENESFSSECVRVCVCCI